MIPTATRSEATRNTTYLGHVWSRLASSLMCDLDVDLAEVARRHDAEPESLEGALAAIDDLADDGIATRDGWRVTVTEAGRPLVRSVCAAFDTYLQKDATRHARAL
jgi:oxygen-independent coproporphyrinogen-3 oxidase